MPCSICAVISRSRSCVVFFCIVGMLHQLLVDRLFCEKRRGEYPDSAPLVVRPGRGCLIKSQPLCKMHSSNSRAVHFAPPAGGLLNAQGAQGRPLHTSPAKFLCIFLSCCYFETTRKSVTWHANAGDVLGCGLSAAPRRRPGSIWHCALWGNTKPHRFGSAGRSCGSRPPRPDRREGRRRGSTGRGGSVLGSGGRDRPGASSSRSPGQSWRTFGGSAAPLWRAVPASAGGLVHCPYLRKYRGTGADVSRTMVAS